MAIGPQQWMEWGIAARPLAGQSVSGDLYIVNFFDHGALLGVVDGVGHGNEAVAAAQIAGDIFKADGNHSLITLVKECHRALTTTRGAVMTLASVNRTDGTVTWLGVGNVEARLLRADAKSIPFVENVLLRGGLVGLRLPALQATVMPVLPGDLLVFATDGLHAGFDSSITLTDPPQRIADLILERHFKGTDDALALAVRYLG